MPRHRKADQNGIMTETRRRLLEAATEEFARAGYDGGNVNRISQAAGYAKGTVYNYFESKHALMLALIDEIAAAHLEFLAQPVRQEAEPTRRLERFFEAGFDWVTENLAQARVLIGTLNGPHVEFKLHMYEVYQPMFALVGLEIVAAGAEQGVFRPSDPEPAARLLMTIYLGVCSQLNEDGQLWFSPGEVTDLLLNGLRADSE